MTEAQQKKALKLLVLGLAGAGVYAYTEFEKFTKGAKYQIKKVTPQFGDNTLTLSVNVMIRNAADITVTVPNVSGDLYLNNNYIGTAYASNVVLQKRTDNVAQLYIQLTDSNVVNAVIAAVKDMQAVVSVQGKLSLLFGIINIKFAEQYNLLKSLNL